jgi:hypothetical protein
VNGRRLLSSARVLVVLAVLVAGVACADGGVSSRAAWYHVDNGARSGCDDAGTGTRRAPWCSLAPLVHRSFGPGDRILLRRGRTWRLPQNARRGLWLSGSGSQTAPITLGAYGRPSDPRPVIVGRRSDNDPSRRDVAVGVTGSWWKIQDLEIRRAGLALVAYNSAPRAVLRGLRFSRLFLHHNRDGIYVGASRQGGVRDVRIEGVQGYANGSNARTVPATVACRPGNPPQRVDTVGGVELNLVGVTGAIVDRVWFHHDLDAAIAMSGGTRNVIVKSSRFDRGSSSYGSCGTTANYLTDVANIAYVNNTFTRTVNSGSGDQSGMDADSDVDGLKIWNNYFGDNTGPGLEILQNSETEAAAPQRVDVRGNLFVNNSRAEPYGLRGAIITGWAAPKREVRPTGRIANNLYLEPTGFTWVYRKAGGRYGFSGFRFKRNVRIASRQDVFHAAEQFSCSPRGAEPWRYQVSSDGASWRDLHVCSGEVPWVGRFEQSVPTDGSWVARSWRAPRAGSVSVRSRALASDAGRGCRIVAEIQSSSRGTVWSSDKVANRSLGVEANLDGLAVARGEVIRFSVRSRGQCPPISWAPAIAYLDR